MISMKGFPFDSIYQGMNEMGLPVGDRDLNSDDWAEHYFASFIDNGVFPYPEPGLSVSANDSMSVSVSEGKCWINGRIGRSEKKVLLGIEPPESFARIDRVIVQFHRVNREVYLMVKKGEESSEPVPPPLQRDVEKWELCLAEVTVAANITEIRQGDIRDTRLDKNLCGLVAALVEHINFSFFFRQYTEQFYDWFNTIKGLLDPDDTTKVLGELTKIIYDVRRLKRKIVSTTFQEMMINGNTIY